MDLVSFSEFKKCVPPDAKFGTYLDLKKSEHFCINKGRRTVDGRRLSWLWIFPSGKVRASNKIIGELPKLVWTKSEIESAWTAANDETLPMFTRHVEVYAELAVTFCLPPPAA